MVGTLSPIHWLPTFCSEGCYCFKNKCLWCLKAGDGVKDACGLLPGQPDKEELDYIPKTNTPRPQPVLPLGCSISFYVPLLASLGASIS